MSTALLKKKVVVIGYGFAGSKFTAQALKKHPDWDITVITPFDYQEVPLRMTESIAAGSAVHDKAIYPLLREPGVTYIIDVVETLTDGSLRTVSGVELTFDAAVLAVGQKIPFFYPDPRTESTAEARKASIRALNETIQVAKSIVVAGGGAVGTEVAADIKLRHPSTSVTVVSSQPDILSSMPPAFRTLAARQLTSEIGVTVKFNARVASHDPKAHSVTLSSGESLPCDVFLAAHPAGGNAGFLPAGAKDTRNYAQVDDTFQVNGLRKVFAFGDGANYDVVKTVPRIDDQLPTVLHNVQLALTTSSTVVSLTHHKKGFMGTVEGPMLVAFGHHHEKGTGVGVSLPGCMGLCCFVCCCFGGPCQTPGGHGAAKMKSDFNDSISPKAGKGMDR